MTYEQSVHHRHRSSNGQRSAVAEIQLGGATGRASAWIAARLAVAGVPLVVHEEPQTSALGEAMLGAAAAGVSLSEAARRMSGKVQRHEPSEAADGKYLELEGIPGAQVLISRHSGNVCSPSHHEGRSMTVPGGVEATTLWPSFRSSPRMRK